MTGIEELQILRLAERGEWPLEEPPRNHRLGQLARLLEELELRRRLAPRTTELVPESEGRFKALAMVLVDAAIEEDEEVLAVAVRELKRLAATRAHSTDPSIAAERGRLVGLIDIVAWAAERTPPLELLRGLVRSGSHAFHMMEAIGARPDILNAELVHELGVSESEVSRCGRKLVDGGLATKVRVGRKTSWRLTPRGRHVVAEAAGRLAVEAPGPRRAVTAQEIFAKHGALPAPAAPAGLTAPGIDTFQHTGAIPADPLVLQASMASIAAILRKTIKESSPRLDPKRIDHREMRVRRNLDVKRSDSAQDDQGIVATARPQAHRSP